MDLFTAFATDEALENEGRWFPLSKTAKVKVARAGNPKYLKLLRKLLEENKVDLESAGEEANELASQVMVTVAAKTILLDWEGIQFKGVDLPYSVENATMLLRDLKEFRKKVDSLSSNFEAYRVKEEAAQGNA
jgi:hypothetical protein